jgi:hypothetical protein
MGKKNSKEGALHAGGGQVWNGENSVGEVKLTRG